jgi:hypothetical protein
MENLQLLPSARTDSRAPVVAAALTVEVARSALTNPRLPVALATTIYILAVLVGTVTEWGK